MNKEELAKLSYKELQAVAAKNDLKSVAVSRVALVESILGLSETKTEEKAPETVEKDAKVELPEVKEVIKEDNVANLPPLKKKKVEVEQPKQQLYNGRLVTNTTNRVLAGKIYIDVKLVNGEVHTMSKEEFDRDVIEQ